ncbi:helix-turn-helix transcriptional regulator [Pseudomonas sp.]|uniref:helix-turn-helix transcriptional regulator n=1 Tax=Pseudomonas sp. TaxID=306 RepID=UPI003D0E45DA
MNAQADSLRQLSLAGRDEPDVVDDARAHIRQRLVLGEPGLEDIAEQIGMTSWSLQRRLREQGLTFSALVDKQRQEMATYYMRQQQLPISELAPLLGYSETSAFSRAFRRWFGVSPASGASTATWSIPGSTSWRGSALSISTHRLMLAVLGTDRIQLIGDGFCLRLTEAPPGRTHSRREAPPSPDNLQLHSD